VLRSTLADMVLCVGWCFWSSAVEAAADGFLQVKLPNQVNLEFYMPESTETPQQCRAVVNVPSVYQHNRCAKYSSSVQFRDFQSGLSDKHHYNDNYSVKCTVR